MKQTFVESLNITNVYQRKVTEKRIDIYFTIHNTPLCMVLELNEEKKIFYPYLIVHNEEDMKLCSICGKNVFNEPFYTKCLSFKNRYDEMFQRLVEHPSIRLEWLYLPHAEV